MILAGAVNDVHRLAELELGEQSTMQPDAGLGRVQVGQPGDLVGLGRDGPPIHIPGAVGLLQKAVTGTVTYLRLLTCDTSHVPGLLGCRRVMDGCSAAYSLWHNGL